jgi:hypothetical protein
VSVRYGWRTDHPYEKAIAMKRIYADFNSRLDQDTYHIRLSTRSNSGIAGIEPGEHVLLYDEEIELEAVVEIGGSTGYVGRYVPGTLRDL